MKILMKIPTTKEKVALYQGLRKTTEPVRVFREKKRKPIGKMPPRLGEKEEEDKLKKKLLERNTEKAIKRKECGPHRGRQKGTEKNRPSR